MLINAGGGPGPHEHARPPHTHARPPSRWIRQTSDACILRPDHVLSPAGLAVKLASEWERLSKAGQLNSGSSARLRDLSSGHLPLEYEAGLQRVDWPGRSQVVEDGVGPRDEGARLSFYIDGAHTPESMETCAEWFAEQCGIVNKTSGGEAGGGTGGLPG